MATVVPFSTSGGRSKTILPGFTAASPTTWRIACCHRLGVARRGPHDRRRAGSCERHGGSPSFRGRREAAKDHKAQGLVRLASLAESAECHISPSASSNTPARPRSARRSAASRDNSAPRGAEAVDPVIRRHDRIRIEAGGVSQPEPQFALRPARAGAVQAGREVALEALLRERAGMAEQAGALALGHDGPAPLPGRRVRRSAIAGWRRRRFRRGAAPLAPAGAARAGWPARERRGPSSEHLAGDGAEPSVGLRGFGLARRFEETRWAG